MQYYNEISQQYEELSIKALDSMPVGTVVEFDGQASDIPAGWQVDTSNILYNNSSGTTGDVTLSDSVNNYRFIEIYSNFYDETTIPAVKLSVEDIKNGKFVISFNQIAQHKSIFMKLYNISGTSITKDSFYFYQIDINDTSTWDQLKITKVIGYK